LGKHYSHSLAIPVSENWVRWSHGSLFARPSNWFSHNPARTLPFMSKLTGFAGLNPKEICSVSDLLQ
ncbi:hypothetical protein A2U01_0068138, partial [Trifolium medium]|nr:hypothetical protein [Trifolium medium]